MRHSLHIISFTISAILLLALPGQARASLNLPFTVTFSEPVTVTGCPANCPRLVLDVGGSTRYAPYAGGSGTATLTFTYTAQAGDVDLDGITVSSNQIDLNTSGTVKDLNGNDLSPPSFSIPNTSGIKVDYPSLSMDMIANDYTLSGTHYASLTNFLTATSGSFTRASVGTYFDSSGVLQTASANTPRFDYDPVTHAAKGLLIEEARTNYATQSATPSNAAWLNAGTSKVTGIASPDGGSNAIKIEETTATGFHHLYQNYTQPDNTVVTVSVFAKVGERNILVVQGKGNDGVTYPNAGFNLTTGIVAFTSNLLSSTITAVGNGWYRCSITFNTGVGGGTGIIFLLLHNGAASNYTGTLGTGLYLWGAQLERGQFPTSFIPTTTASVTRAIDNLSLPSAAWADAAKGTFFIDAHKAVPQGVSSRYYSLIDSSAGQVSLINDQAGTSITGYVTDSGGAVSTNLTASGLTTGSIFRSALAYAANDFSQSTNGTAVVTDTLGTFPTMNTLVIGNNAVAGSRAINSTLRKLRYYPARAIDAQLQLLTQ